MFTIISIFSIHFPFKDKWGLGISGYSRNRKWLGKCENTFNPLASLISDSSNIESRIPQPRSPFSDNCMFALVCDIISFHHHHHRINTICFSLENILKLSQIHTHSTFEAILMKIMAENCNITPKEWETLYRLATNLLRCGSDDSHQWAPSAKELSTLSLK